MINELSVEHVPHMLRLQQHCLDHGDLFTPTSERGYALCYQFQNFCLGIWNELHDELIAFLSCTIPTARASRNFGRGRLPDELLDRVGHMNTLLIHAEHRGKGLGKTLMRIGVERLHRSGVGYIYAVVSPGNAISKHMLDALGFVQVESILLNGEPKLLFLMVN